MKSLRIASIVVLSFILIIELSVLIDEIRNGTSLITLFGGLILIAITSIPYIYIYFN